MFMPVILTDETWLICGGRDFADVCMFDSVLGTLMNNRGCPARVVHGAAKGADTMAGEFARRMSVEEIPVPADWKRHGKGAGPIRNQRMLDEYRPQLVIAFPGGRGTADMVLRARKAGVTVAEVKAPVSSPAT
jgi:hypothetical protein